MDRIKELQKDHEKLQSNHEAIQKRADDIHTTFQDIDNRFVDMGKRFEDMEKEFGNMKNRFVDFEQQLNDEYERSQAQLKKMDDRTSERIAALEQAVGGMEEFLASEEKKREGELTPDATINQWRKGIAEATTTKTNRNNQQHTQATLIPPIILTLIRIKYQISD